MTPLTSRIAIAPCAGLGPRTSAPAARRVLGAAGPELDGAVVVCIRARDMQAHAGFSGVPRTN